MVDAFVREKDLKVRAEDVVETLLKNVVVGEEEDVVGNRVENLVGREEGVVGNLVENVVGGEEGVVANVVGREEDAVENPVENLVENLLRNLAARVNTTL